MKKALLVVALATALVFAFSGVAFAKYAGYAYNNPVVVSTNPLVTEANPVPGYLSWDGAMAINPTQTGSPHGGYTANTVKCAVCHSVHRAASDRTSSGVGSYWKLTPGGSSCTACHTPSGANPSAKLVEWPSTYTAGGPHRGFNCTGQCHAGIHGFTSSKYDTAARFLLNPNVRAGGEVNGGVGLDGGLDAAIAAGNVNLQVTEAALLSGVVNKGTRAMVTGYLCGQAGCHTSSQFAVNTDGYAEMRVSMPSDAYGPYDVAFTGHDTGTISTHCFTSGCHAVPNDIDDSNCATCHDFRGRATGTTAWPHANRGIDVYEWVRPSVAGTLETIFTPVVSGNLWMYTGDVTFRDANGEPTSTLMWDGKTGVGVTHGGTVEGFAPDSINTRKVLQGNSAFNLSTMTPGNIQDGVCLKCHGFGYSPYHGQGSLGDPDHQQFDRNFANY